MAFESRKSLDATRSLDDWRRAGASFRFEGHNYFYVDSDAGAEDAETLLVLHGFPTSTWDWHVVWPDLADEYRLVTADMLGFGFSDKPRGHDYSLFDQTDAHLALLENLAVDRVHVLAHDYGDTVAQELLARRVEGALDGLSLESVTLLNGGLDYDAIRQRPLQRILRTPVVGTVASKLMNYPLFARRFSTIFGSATRPSKSELEDFWEAILYNGGPGVVDEVIQYLDERRDHRARWVGALRETDIPMRFVVGMDDPVSGANIARRYREVVPEPDVVELPGIGHYPQLEAPDRTLEALLDLVESTR